MLSKKYIKTLLVLCLLNTGNYFADTQIQLLYTAANPDWKPFETTYGFSIAGQYDFDNGLFLSGFYNETDFLGSGPEVGSVNVDSWLETGIGYAWDHDWGEFYSLITFSTITTETNTYDGFGAHFGYKNNFAGNWTAVLQAGYLETEFHDFQLEAKLNYNISDNFSVSIGLRDYHDWDYTSYETGISYLF